MNKKELVGAIVDKTGFTKKRLTDKFNMYL